MNIDLKQFHAVFFEESLEGLDLMESTLLEMEDESDNEQINTVFRSAHSIKGGAGTFGFTHIAEFTHVVETLLDKIRSGDMTIRPDITRMLLESVDVIRSLIAKSQRDEDISEDEYADLQQQLTDILTDGGAAAEQIQDDDDPEEEIEKPSGWLIHFCPHEQMLLTGNDPVMMINALKDLGELTVEPDLSKMPGLCDIDPEKSYLQWDMVLKGDCTIEQIQEVFEWVEDECDLDIAPLVDESETEKTVEITEVSGDEPGKDLVALERRRKADRREGEERRKEASRRTADMSQSGSSSIRVSTEKIDELINMVGELVITQSMLGMLGESFDVTKIERLQDGLVDLERHTRQLQESIMRIRMVPINFVFSRFPRMVHDLSQKLGKKVDLHISGEYTELDKTVIEQIGDPLTHLVRNSVDHGVEIPKDRLAAGKPEVGEVSLNAYHKGGSIFIEISDDGAGLNPEKLRDKAVSLGLLSEEEEVSDEKLYEFIFHAGFSTAKEVSDVSGRGVGMDVVRKNINRLGGNIEVRSSVGQGTIFRISLPLTLAILDGQIIRVGDEKYVVPIASILESIQVKKDMVNKVSGKGEVFELRGEYVPVLRLYESFSVESEHAEKLEDGLLVVVEGDGKKCGFFVDELLAQQQVVIKSLETNFLRVQGLSGATIFGDGSVALILDVPGMVRMTMELQENMA